MYMNIHQLGLKKRPVFADHQIWGTGYGNSTILAPKSSDQETKRMTSHPNSNASFINIRVRLIWRRSSNSMRSSNWRLYPTAHHVRFTPNTMQRDLRLTYERKMAKMAVTQELVGKVISESLLTRRSLVSPEYSTRNDSGLLVFEVPRLSKMVASDQLAPGCSFGLKFLVYWSQITQAARVSFGKVDLWVTWKWLTSHCRVTCEWENLSLRLPTNDTLHDMKMGLCLLLRGTELWPEGQQQEPSSQVSLSFRLKTRHRSCIYIYWIGLNTVVNSRKFGIWLCFNLIRRSYRATSTHVIYSTHRTSGRSCLSRRSVASQSQGIANRLGLGPKFITAVAHWLGLLGPKFHADKLTNDIRRSRAIRSLVVRT